MIKLVLFFALGLMTLCMFLSWRTGKIIAKNDRDKVMFRVHFINARIIFWFTVLSVLFVEFLVRWSGGRTQTDTLFWTHLAFASVWLLGLGLLNWPMNGNSKYHRQTAYFTAVAFLATASTAVPIVLRL